MDSQDPSQVPQGGDIIRPDGSASPQPPENSNAGSGDASASHPLLGDAAIPSLRPFGSQNAQDASTPEDSEAVSDTPPEQEVPQPEFAVRPAPAYMDAPAAQQPNLTDPLGYQPEQNTGTGFTPSQPAGTVPSGSPVIGLTGAVYYGKSPKKSLFRRPLAFVGIVVFVLLLGGGFVFGYYLPNKPENVFKTGLSRTNIMVQRLETTATDKTKLASLKNVDFSGSLSVNGPDGTQGGTFSTRYDDKVSDSTLTYNPGSGKQKFSLRAMTQLNKGKNLPDIYFKVTGLSAFGLDQAVPPLTQYDGKWISISSDYLQSLIPADLNKPDQSKTTLTSDDAVALTKVAIDTTREYVFTNDTTKAVLENRGYKGQEKIENNLKADHYVVGINKQHAKDYCKALITNIMAAPAFKHVPGAPTDNMASSRQSAISACQKNIDDNLKASDTFDMWVGTGKKLINKIRLTDVSDKTAYLDFGQTYSSGNNLPIFLNAHSTKDNYDFKSNMNINMDTSASTGSVVSKFQDSDNKPWTVNVNFSLKPNQGNVTITKPSDAIPIQQVFQALGLDPSEFTGGSGGGSTPNTSSASAITTGRNDQAKDTERQTDLRMLQNQLEQYYAENGSYPQISDINSASWRSANMPGLDNQTLSDPDGNIPTLVPTATATQYGYVPGTCDASGFDCQSYVLTARLSDGQIYTISSSS